MSQIGQTFAAILIGYPGVTAWMPPDRTPAEPPPQAVPAELMDTSLSTADFRAFDPEDWAPRSVSGEMSVQYQDLVREFEAREPYGLVDENEIARQLTYRRNFARYALLRLGAVKADKELRRFDKRHGGAGARAARTYRKVLGAARAPVAVATKSQGLSYGTSIALLELEAKSWLNSGLVNGEILYRPERSWLPAILKTRLDLLEPEERWLFSVSMPDLPGETLGKLSYGSTSSRLRFSLRKNFSQWLSSEYQASRPLLEGSLIEHVLAFQYVIKI